MCLLLFRFVSVLISLVNMCVVDLPFSWSPRGRQCRRCLSASGTELRHCQKERHPHRKVRRTKQRLHQKERRCKECQLGLVHPPPEVVETPRSNCTSRCTTESYCEFDVDHAWNPWERVTIRGIEDNLQQIREDTLVEVVELEAHLLGPTDVTGIVNVLAKNACNGSGYRFVFIKRKGSMRVCEKIWKETTRSCKSSSSA